MCIYIAKFILELMEFKSVTLSDLADVCKKDILDKFKAYNLSKENYEKIIEMIQKEIEATLKILEEKHNIILNKNNLLVRKTQGE